MSDITLLSDNLDALLPELAIRTPGLHVKAIIDDIALIQGFLTHDVQLTTTWAQFGQIWEWAVVTRYQQLEPGRYIQLGEVERDGIYGTLDLYDTQDMAPEDIKLKWMSSSHSITSEKFWRDWTQVAAYCHMTESGIGRLHVGFVNGDRSKGIGPSVARWERGFSSRELRETWAMIKNHGERNRERLEERAA